MLERHPGLVVVADAVLPLQIIPPGDSHLAEHGPLASVRQRPVRRDVTLLLGGSEDEIFRDEIGPGNLHPRHGRDGKHEKKRRQLRGGKRLTLGPGQTFYEGPADVHVVGINASKTKPAKFVVFLVKNKDAPVLVPSE